MASDPVAAPAWHVTKMCMACIKDQANCRICEGGRQFTTTGRLHRHLRRGHRGHPRVRLCTQ